MDFFHNNIKMGHSDLKGYDLPKSVHNTNGLSHKKNMNRLNTLEQTVIKARGKSKYTGVVSMRKFGI